MTGLLAFAHPLLVAGVRDRYLIAVVVVVVIAALLLYVRSRRPALVIKRLEAAEAERYTTAFIAVEAEFQSQPQVAIGRARGIVDEVMRRMGFPDRLDAGQRQKDLAGFDRSAAEAYRSAARDAAGADSAAMGRAMTGYRHVLDRLLAAPRGG